MTSMNESLEKNITTDLLHPPEPTRGQKLFLIYDMLMMLVIISNLLTLAVDQLFFTNLMLTVSKLFGHGQWVLEYRQHIHPLIHDMDEWFTVFLISELSVRWALAILNKSYQRWFFFPFVHWYEVLACLPSLRALRLLRAVAIGYRLYQMGYKIIPDSWLKRGRFYYDLVMEELSDRIVLTVLDGVEKELDSTGPKHHLIQDLIDQHRILLTNAVAELLQYNLATALQAQQQTIVSNVGKIVNQSIANTPELHQLLRLMPVVGSMIEHQIQTIGQRLGENIAEGLLEPFVQDEAFATANPALQTAANYVGNIQVNTPELEKLVSSLVLNSLEAIRKQVKIQQWKLAMEQDAANETS